MSSLFLELSRDSVSAASQTVQFYCFIMPYHKKWLLGVLPGLSLVHFTPIFISSTMDLENRLPHPIAASFSVSTSVIFLHRVFLFLKSTNWTTLTPVIFDCKTDLLKLYLFLLLSSGLISRGGWTSNFWLVRLRLHKNLASLPGSTESNRLTVPSVLGIFMDSLDLHQKRESCKKLRVIMCKMLQN